MGDKRVRKPEIKSSVEWDLQVITGLNLPDLYVSALDRLLLMAKNHCLSIVLNGSWANGSARTGSDLDLLFITKTEDRKRALVTVTRELKPRLREIGFDIKNLCSTEIKQMSSSSQHFAIWALVSQGIVLHGIDPKSMVALELEKIRSLIFDMMSELNEYFTMLESNRCFTGACIYIAYVGRTLYFIERDILRAYHLRNKETYLKELLGASYNRIERIYKDSIQSHKNWGEMEVRMRVTSRKDRSYSKEQYQELVDICVRLEDVTQAVNHRLNSTYTLV